MGRHYHTEREYHEKAETEIGVEHLQAKECQRLPATSRSYKRATQWILPERLQREHGPTDALISHFQPPQL